MRVNNIQNNDTSFGAKLRVIDKFFVSKELKEMRDITSKIGYENDVLELSFSNYRDESIEFADLKGKNFASKLFSTLKARFIPNDEGRGTDLFKIDIYADDYKTLWYKEFGYSKAYINRLYEKYPNDFKGVSIIEN